MKNTPASTARVRTRDPERTKGEILDAALSEFAANGYDGAKVHQIAKNAGCNARLIYHYFDNKERLYAASLRKVYSDIREREAQLNLGSLPPEQAVMRLTEATFDFFENNTAFLSITRSENLLGGRFISQMPEIQKMSAPLLDKITDALKRGRAEGVFRSGIDALQLYISIVALSAHHINASHTLSATFGRDISSVTWRQERRAHVVEMIQNAITVSESSD